MAYYEYFYTLEKVSGTNNMLYFYYFRMILEDVTTAPVSPLESWNDYYIWRGFDMSSPIAVLMHTVLTVYHIIQVSFLMNILK